MDFAIVEQSIKATYKGVWQKYRRDDELEVMTGNHRRLANVLRDTSTSFHHPISALDAGCGTGRYFHCLGNVELLVGLDLCPEMLEAARRPVREELIQATHIRRVCENIHHANFPPGTFDFIYSLGMFGNGCPVTVELCNRFHDWLTPGGRLFFNTIHHPHLSFYVLLKKWIRRTVYALAPRQFKELLDEREQRLPFFPLTRPQLQDILYASRFKDFEIVNRVCESPLWRGTHLECSAWKTG